MRTGKRKKGGTLLNNQDIAHREKIRAAILSIIASAGLTISKIIVALFTNSLGILSEGLHSGLDLVAASMTLYAVRMARRPPDLEHNYGYGKIESLTSLGEIILLLIIAAWIMYEGIERLFYTHSQPEITVFSFGVMISSIIVDYGRSKALYKVAKKYGSQALEADALHFRVDMLTSGMVLVGLFVVFLFNIPNADVYAAISVSLLIVYTSLGLGRRTLDVLLDKAPKGIQGQIVESLKGFEGIKNIHSIRIRKVGKDVFIDLHIEVSRIFTHDKAHRIATNVEDKIKRDVLPNSDVVVHVDAIKDDDTETLKDKIRLIATEYPAIENIHSIYFSIVTETNDPNSYSMTVTNDESIKRNHPSSLHLYLDIQMESSLNLNAAHDIVDDFEKKIKEQISEIKHITTHIESELGSDQIIGSEELIDQAYLEKIKNTALSIEGVIDCKDVSVVYISNEMHITFTIKLDIQSNKRPPPSQTTREDAVNHDLTVEEAHQIATKVQNMVIKNTGAARVIIHTEPCN